MLMRKADGNRKFESDETHRLICLYRVIISRLAERTAVIKLTCATQRAVMSHTIRKDK